tara:strand:+ start:3607 stop:4848 length:1242 start_codon:yes stop_codon:yes gene_type:complete
MKKILIKGPVLTRSGYGEQARFALRSLASRPDLYDLYLMATGWGKTSWVIEDNPERDWIDHLINKTASFIQSGGKFDESLQVTIPNEWERIAPYNVGYTAGIETTKVAPEWIEKANMMDKIIVVSNHSKNVFEDTAYVLQNDKQQRANFQCSTEIEVVNYPVKKYDPVDLELNLPYDFNFLCVAQWGPRKNVKNTIKWFVEEFHDDEVGLVVKMFQMKNCHMDKQNCITKLTELLRQYPDKKCKLHLIHGNMTDEEMNSLYTHPKLKAFVTLTHGEGYGLPLFEAAYNGMPVVAPAWSGHCDFLFAPVKKKGSNKTKIRPLFAKVDYDLKPIQKEAVWKGVLQPDSMWCYARETSYKRKLREVYKSHSMFVGHAKKLKKHLNSNFTNQIMYSNFVNAMASKNTSAEDSLVMVV